MNYTIIAAIGKNNELGRDNNLIWSLKGDLKFFKEKTTNHTIIMGRKTFESLPKMLPNRHHVVLTRNKIENNEVEVFNDIQKLLEHFRDSEEELFIIGGASIYKTFLPYANKMYLTHIDEECSNADAYFPKFDRELWEVKELLSTEENNIKYSHVLYKRK